MKIEKSTIYALLNSLGLTTNYAGAELMACALRLCTEDPERLVLLTKHVYPEVGRQCGKNWRAVERNIRSGGEVIWRRNRRLLERLARRPLERRPRNGELLAILSSALLSSPTVSLAVHGLGETVTFPGENDDMGVMDQAVNQGSSQTVIAKDSIPLAELKI